MGSAHLRIQRSTEQFLRLRRRGVAAQTGTASTREIAALLGNRYRARPRPQRARPDPATRPTPHASPANRSRDYINAANGMVDWKTGALLDAFARLPLHRATARRIRPRRRPARRSRSSSPRCCRRTATSPPTTARDSSGSSSATRCTPATRCTSPCCCTARAATARAR